MTLIDLFSKPEIAHFSKLSVEGTTFISEDDIVKYVLNHLGEPRGFQLFEHVLLNQMQNDYLVGRLIERLRQQRVKAGGSLPESLSPENVKKLYLKTKAIAT